MSAAIPSAVAQDKTTKITPAKSTGAKDKAKTAEVKLQEASWKEITKYVKSQKGKVVVLDLWSTSCLPCMREFPHLVALSKKHPKKLSCISVSTDYYGVATKPPKYYRPRVEKFLKRQKAVFKNFISSTSSDELFEEIDLGSIPAILVFDKTGKLVKRFDNDDIEDEDDVFSYKKDINPLVAKLVKQIGR